MIQVVLADGTRRDLADAEATLTWAAPEDPAAKSDYTFDDVKALIVTDPDVGTMAGIFHDMPIMGIAFTDDRSTGLRIEVPMPLGFANDFGLHLVRETDRYALQVKIAGGNGRRALERFQALPADTPPPPGE